MMRGYMALEQIAEQAGCPGKIFMQNEEGKETFMLMLDGDELTKEHKTVRPEPVMVFLSELMTDTDNKGKKAALLSLTQTIRYNKADEDIIKDCLHEWQSSVISLGVIWDQDEEMFVLKNAFPLPNGTDGLIPQVFLRSVEIFRNEAERLYEILNLKLTGGEEA